MPQDSQPHRWLRGRLVIVVLGGSLAGSLAGCLVGASALALAIAATQMPGCCGGSPNHGCKFVETPDAAMDQAAADAAIPCPFAPCVPGQTFCCIEPDSQEKLRCLAIGQACTGLTGECRADQDCPFGTGLHCCGNVNTLSTQCRADCSGHFKTDQTVRVCQSSAECPADLPECTRLTVDQNSFYGCVNPLQN